MIVRSFKGNFWGKDFLQFVFWNNFILGKSRPQDRTLECSTCQLLVPVPAKGIEAFPLNFFINNMLTVLAVQNPTKCTNCEDSSQATARCLDCVENLCSNCVFAHKRIRQTKDHRILSFDEIQANEIKDIIRCPSFCSVHPREVLFSCFFVLFFFSFFEEWWFQLPEISDQRNVTSNLPENRAIYRTLCYSVIAHCDLDKAKVVSVPVLIVNTEETEDGRKTT